MNWIDFFIGFTLMNAMPHFVLGVWGGRMFSIFGFGNRQNLAYSLLNFLISAGLFGYHYGWVSIGQHGMYCGALAILVLYYLTGHFWRNLFVER